MRRSSDGKLTYHAVYPMNCICMRYSLLFALFSRHFILCIEFYALNSMHWILCIVFNELYSRHYILWTLFFALNSMHWIICIVTLKLVTGQHTDGQTLSGIELQLKMEWNGTGGLDSRLLGLGLAVGHPSLSLLRNSVQVQHWVMQEPIHDFVFLLPNWKYLYLWHKTRKPQVLIYKYTLKITHGNGVSFPIIWVTCPCFA